jgi:decaprenylphospho-beta-D-erythro-pentofuranosid-2-ulose 2-reductase
VDVATSTYVGALEGALIGAGLLKRQGHGTLVVISSVAAMRPRKSNFIYGSAKAGVDFLARGLQDALRGTGVTVLLVRPGFVKTRMTATLDPAPLAQTPEEVGVQVAAAIRRGKTRIYAPPTLRYIMGVLTTLPGPLFRNLPL